MTASRHVQVIWRIFIILVPKVHSKRDADDSTRFCACHVFNIELAQMIQLSILDTRERRPCLMLPFALCCVLPPSLPCASRLQPHLAVSGLRFLLNQGAVDCKEVPKFSFNLASSTGLELIKIWHLHAVCAKQQSRHCREALNANMSVGWEQACLADSVHSHTLNLLDCVIWTSLLSSSLEMKVFQ